MSKSKQLDMVNGPLAGRIILYALQIAATAILQQLFNAADVAVVGQLVGAPAMAAVGANSSVISLIVNMFVGFSLGANVVIATAIGSNDYETVHKAVHTSILVSLIAGIIAAILGELAVGPIVSVLGVPSDVLSMATIYLRIYFIGIPVIILYNFEASFFRSMGDTKTPLIVLTISGIINVILNLFFVAILKRNVDGVAMATLISNVFSCIVLLIILSKTSLEIRIRKDEFRIDKKTLIKIMKIGVPAGLQNAVFSIANIVIQSAINSLGTIVMAASSAAFNIEVFAYDVINSFSQSCTTFVGQNNGAGKINRCKKVLIVCYVEAALTTALSVFLILLFGEEILSIFNSDPKVISIGYIRLVYIFTAYIFTMQYELMSGYLRGFGISTLPSILTTVGIVGVRLGFIFFVFPMNRTFQTIMMTYPASLATTAVLLYIAAFITRPAKKRIQEIS